MSEHVIVAVRCRPITPQEEVRQSRDDRPFTLRMDEHHTYFTDPAVPQVVRTFDFDHNFWSLGDPHSPDFASQRRIFEKLGQPLLTHAFSGYNACIFAYGQTCSGKTYTMMGPPEDVTATRRATHAGLIPRTCDELFCRIDQAHQSDPSVRVSVLMSFYEIYNERIYDLLDPSTDESLRIREDKKQVYVDGLSECPVEHYLQIEELLKIGNRRRHTGATRMNDRSSRSHAIFCLLIRKRQWHRTEGDTSVFTSRVNLVDLAGSERTNKAGTEGSALREGIHINLGLSKLGAVIRKLADLSDKHGARSDGDFVPYRDSVLTRVLQDNLGGSSCTVMLATVSPCFFNADETLNTLRYAERVKFIRNNPTVNESSTDMQTLALRRKVRELEAMLSGRATGVPSSGLVPSGLSPRDVYARGLHTAAAAAAAGVARARGPMLVMVGCPRKGDTIHLAIQEGFTVVSDAAPPEADPAATRSPDHNGLERQGSREHLLSQTQLGGSFGFPGSGLGGSFANLGGSVEAETLRRPRASSPRPSARRDASAPKPTAGVSRGRSRRGSASYMNPTLASGMKNLSMAALLEGASQAGELGRDVAHTFTTPDDPPVSGRARSATAARSRSARDSEHSRSRSPRPRTGTARTSGRTIQRALQIARDRISKEQQDAPDGRECSVPHIVDDEEPSGQIVHTELVSADEAESPPLSGRRALPGGRSGGSRTASPNAVMPLLPVAELGQSHDAGDEAEPHSARSARSDAVCYSSLHRDLERLWDSSGTPALRPSVERLQELTDDVAAQCGVQHLRLQPGVPGTGCPHALIRCIGDDVWVMPLSGRTLVSGREVGERGAHKLRSGCLLQFGDHPEYRYLSPSAAGDSDDQLEWATQQTGVSSTSRRSPPPGGRSEREELALLRVALADKEHRLVNCHQDLIEERQLRAGLESMRRERDEARKERDNLRHALGRAGEEVNELRDLLTDAEGRALQDLCEKRNNEGMTGTQHQVFVKTADKPYWRPVGPPMCPTDGDPKSNEFLVLVDERQSAAAQLQRDAESLRQLLRHTEGELLRAQQDRDEALTAAEQTRRNAEATKREAERIRGEAVQQMTDTRRECERTRSQTEAEMQRHKARAAELEEDARKLGERVQVLRDKERERLERAGIDEAERAQLIEERLVKVQHEEDIKKRQIAILQEKIGDQKASIDELAAEKKRKLDELSSEIGEKLEEKAAVAAEVKELHARARALREEEERRRAYMERLRRQRDDMMDSTELNCIDEAEFCGLRLDDSIFRRKGIQLSRQSRTPVKIIFGAHSLRVVNANADALRNSVPSAPGAPPYRRPASPSRGPLGAASQHPGLLHEMRYDAVRLVKQLDGAILSIEGQGRGEIALLCDDRLRRNTVHKMLQLKTKGVILPLRHADIAESTEYRLYSEDPPPFDVATAHSATAASTYNGAHTARSALAPSPSLRQPSPSIRQPSPLDRPERRSPLPHQRIPVRERPPR